MIAGQGREEEGRGGQQPKPQHDGWLIDVQMDKAEKRKAMVANNLNPNMVVDYLIVVQMDKAEKRKAMVANILDPNMVVD